MKTLINFLLEETQLVIQISKNMEPATYFGSRFAQDVEPKGTYVTHGHVDLPNYKNGMAVLNNPLYININDDSLVQYKRDLSDKYKSKGQKLTNKLMSIGYDGIVTVNQKHGEYGEIILFPNAQFMFE